MQFNKIFSDDAKGSYYLLALCLFLGLFSLGYFLNSAILQTKALERSVIVKGLAEKDFTANSVVWPIQYRVSANTLEEIFTSNESYKDIILKFLSDAGIEESEIVVMPPQIDNRSVYASKENMPIFSYSSSATIAVKSEKVDLVAKLTLEVYELLQNSVPLENNYNTEIVYTFTELNEIKPMMIELATKNAREVAEKFAKDSDSYLGKIKNANQGQFSISTTDKYSPQVKTVRVVSTVEYYLVD